MWMSDFKGAITSSSPFHISQDLLRLFLTFLVWTQLLLNWHNDFLYPRNFD